MKVFKAELQVRGYELDGYGHVNHAVYLNYAEFARWRMMEEAASGMDYFKRNGVSPVVVRTEVDYREPCYLGDSIVVETVLEEYRKRVVRFRHKVIKKATGTLAAEALVSLAVVGVEGKVVSFPEDFEKTFG